MTVRIKLRRLKNGDWEMQIIDNEGYEIATVTCPWPDVARRLVDVACRAMHDWLDAQTKN